MRKLEWKVLENGCWELTSYKPLPIGYYQIRPYKKSPRIYAHRFIYQECFGEIPENMVIRHKCDNRNCINPEHLEIGTQADNLADMTKRGRRYICKGEKNGQSKLTNDQVKEIRQDKRTLRQIATTYGVTPQTISNIKNNVYWK